MASSRDVRSARHVGQVIDPLVRDDGVLEPEMRLEPQPLGQDEAAEPLDPRRIAAPCAEVSSAPEESAPHPVRERLLARAAEARRGPEPEQMDRGPFGDVLGSFTDELDRVATRAAMPPSSPSLGSGRPPLPPNVLAFFGGLLGLSLLATLFSVLVHLDPRDGTPIAPIESAAPTHGSAQAPEPPPAPVAKKPERQRLPGPWRIADSTDPKLKKIEASIGHASFLKALEDAGVPHAQTFRILKVMKDLRDLNHCGKSDQFAALLDRAANRVVAFEYVVSREEVYQAREGPDGFLKAARLDLHVERARVQGAVRLEQASFAQNLEAGGFEPSLSAVLDDALEGHMSVADFRHGDRLRIVAQEITVLGDFAKYAGIEALEYVPAKADEKPLRIYYFKGTNSHGYYDAEGRAVNEGGWRKPIKGAPITSHFNPKRMHPILHKIMPHQGTDFGAPMGTPVGAAGPGTVHFIGYEGPGGNLVVIEHSGGIQTGYAHLSRFEPGLKVGDHVSQLQIVGYVGSTGRSTGPHLHFSVKKDGVFVDAEKTLRFDSLRILPQDERVEFMDERAKLDALLDAIPLPPSLSTSEPAPAVSAEPTPDDLADDHAPEEAAPAATAASAVPAGTPSAPLPAPPTSPPAAPQGAPAGRGPPIYMSDQDLLKNQPATDNGEVER